MKQSADFVVDLSCVTFDVSVYRITVHGHKALGEYRNLANETSTLLQRCDDEWVVLFVCVCVSAMSDVLCRTQQNMRGYAG